MTLAGGSGPDFRTARWIFCGLFCMAAVGLAFPDVISPDFKVDPIVLWGLIGGGLAMFGLAKFPQWPGGGK